MPVSDTLKEVYVHLDKITRDVDSGELDRFTTSSIASEISVSRTLASQHLNELVRKGLAIKVDSRPVFYFHKRGLERYLHSGLDQSVYSTIDELFSATGDPEAVFCRAVGHDLSLNASIEKCKAALNYPPFGLPVLFVGAEGVGKGTLASLSFEFAKSSGIIAEDSKLVRVDCKHYAESFEAFRSRLHGAGGTDSWASESKGGMVLFEHVERLQPIARSLLLSFILPQQGRAVSPDASARFMMTMSSAETRDLVDFSSHIPMVIAVPSFKERSADERSELVLSCLREEARRMGCDVRISRSAFRCLSEADYRGNIDELKSCITMCCAEAFLKSAQENVTIQTYHLPDVVLGNMSDLVEADSDGFIDVSDSSSDDEVPLMLRSFDGIVRAFEMYRRGGKALDDFLSDVSSISADLIYDMLFKPIPKTVSFEAYEQVADSVVERVNSMHETNFTRKISRLIAQEIYLQLWPDAQLASWKLKHLEDLSGVLAQLSDAHPFASSLMRQVSDELFRILGVEFDCMSQIVCLIAFETSDELASQKEFFGVILCHGYATATSIADTANRILQAHVFEAIDMTLDQQVSDVVKPLQAVIDRYAYCKNIALLVDMGSLEEIYECLSVFSNLMVGVINNASAGLAIEVGSGLLAGKSLEDTLSGAVDASSCRYKVIERTKKDDAILFCSESGIEAADKIRLLVMQSIDRDIPACLRACSFQRLAENGSSDRLFSHFNVRGIVGTMDPQIEGVPFIPLESVMSGGKDRRIDVVLSSYLDNDDLELFHQNVLKKMTLETVVSSISILNPEQLVSEVEKAVKLLQEATGEELVGSNAIGLYVHLCCLVERLVTRNPMENYGDILKFESSHRQFIRAFKNSFQGISSRYHIEIPVSEIAYAFDYMTIRRAADDTEATTPSLVDGRRFEDE